MSFLKALRCFQCSKQQSISDADFPEDLFDLITKYKMEQLFWLCRECKYNEIRPPTASDCLSFEDNSNLIAEHLKKNLNLTGEEKETYKAKELQRTEDVESLDSKDNSILLPSLSNESPSGGIKEDKSGLKYVHKILNVIKIDSQEETRNKGIVQSVINYLLTRLKQDATFQFMFNRMFYTGSSYNDLRITSASEYDINIVLKLPKSITLIPELHDNCSFGKLKWEVMNCYTDSNLPVTFLTNCSNRNYLVPKLVLSWFQRQIDLALIQDQIFPPNVQDIKSFQNGPARTINIKTDLGYKILIDMVPVFEFNYSSLSEKSVFFKLPVSGDNNKNKWFMVPKESQGQIDAPHSEFLHYWRLDYPYADKHILSGKECAKSVIKMLKIFRDKKEWKALSSYYLNMVVILEIVKNPAEEFWKNGNLYIRLMDAFKQLRNYLRDRCLPHFLTGDNLLHKFNEDHCTNWHNHLTRLIPAWESSPDKLIDYLG